MMPNVDDVIAWEDGAMTEDQEIRFFQGLVDSGLAWSFQGCYGRRAMELIYAGLVTQKGEPGR